MLPQWTHHLKTDDEKTRFRKYVYSSKGVIDRLKDLMEQDENELNSKEVDESSYDSPSWAALQADRNGYRRCLRKFKKLLTLDQKENND